MGWRNRCSFCDHAKTRPGPALLVRVLGEMRMKSRSRCARLGGEMMWDEPGDARTRVEHPPGLSHDRKQKAFRGAACGGIAWNHDTDRLAALRQDGMASRGTDGVCTRQSRGMRTAGAQCEASPVLSRWKGARSGVSGGESRQEPSLLSRLSRYPCFQAGRANCVCRWLSSTRDACGRGQGVSLALAKAEMISRVAAGSTSEP